MVGGDTPPSDRDDVKKDASDGRPLRLTARWSPPPGPVWLVRMVGKMVVVVFVVVVVV